jgi:hypothetical protein
MPKDVGEVETRRRRSNVFPKADGFLRAERWDGAGSSVGSPNEQVLDERMDQLMGHRTAPLVIAPNTRIPARKSSSCIVPKAPSLPRRPRKSPPAVRANAACFLRPSTWQSPHHCPFASPSTHSEPLPMKSLRELRGARPTLALPRSGRYSPPGSEGRLPESLCDSPPTCTRSSSLQSLGSLFEFPSAARRSTPSARHHISTFPHFHVSTFPHSPSSHLSFSGISSPKPS